jgi:hypothetical protein
MPYFFWAGGVLVATATHLFLSSTRVVEDYFSSSSVEKWVCGKNFATMRV